MSSIKYKVELRCHSIQEQLNRLGGSFSSRTLTYIFIPAIIIVGFLLNHIFDYNYFGIRPREFSLRSLYGMLFSWIMHDNFDHIKNNMILLLQILIPFVLIEKRPARMFLGLCAVSGLFTWIFGVSNSLHVGASGVFFALVGYILVSSVFADKIGKKLVYLTLVILFGYQYWNIVKNGLTVQENVSFAGHFGGLLGGAIAGYIFNKNR